MTRIFIFECFDNLSAISLQAQPGTAPAASDIQIVPVLSGWEKIGAKIAGM
jgi:hypothetical protein